MPGAIATPAIFAFASTTTKERAVPKSETMHAHLLRSHASSASHKRSVPISWTALSGIFTGREAYMSGPMMSGFLPMMCCVTFTKGPVKFGTTELMTAESMSERETEASRISVRIVEKYSSPVRFTSELIRHT